MSDALEPSPTDAPAAVTPGRSSKRKPRKRGRFDLLRLDVQDIQHVVRQIRAVLQVDPQPHTAEEQVGIQFLLNEKAFSERRSGKEKLNFVPLWGAATPDGWQVSQNRTVTA